MVETYARPRLERRREEKKPGESGQTAGRRAIFVYGSHIRAIAY